MSAPTIKLKKSDKSNIKAIFTCHESFDDLSEECLTYCKLSLDIHDKKHIVRVRYFQNGMTSLETIIYSHINSTIELVEQRLNVCGARDRIDQFTRIFVVPPKF